LGLLTGKTLPDNLYCVGGVVKPCSLTRCIQLIRGFGNYALYKSMFYLLIYLKTKEDMTRNIESRCGDDGCRLEWHERYW